MAVEWLYRITLAEENYIKPSPVYAEGWMEFSKEGKFLLGTVETYLEAKGLLRIGASSRKDMLHMVSNHPNQSASAYVNNKVFNHGVHHHLKLLNGETVWTQPSFLIMGELALNSEDVRSLLKLTFARPTDEKEISNADH